MTDEETWKQEAIDILSQKYPDGFLWVKEQFVDGYIAACQKRQEGIKEAVSEADYWKGEAIKADKRVKELEAELATEKARADKFEQADKLWRELFEKE